MKCYHIGGMQFTHKESGGSYTVLHESFDVKTQAPAVVYINTTGQIFNRDKADFMAKFELKSVPQLTIKPRGNESENDNAKA